MLALFSAVFILFGAPAMLLLAGRLIQSRTDALHRAATLPDTILKGTEWYYRPPEPLLGDAVNHAVDAGADTSDESGRWFHRPLPPLFVWPDLRQIFWRFKAARST